MQVSNQPLQSDRGHKLRLPRLLNGKPVRLIGGVKGIWPIQIAPVFENVVRRKPQRNASGVASRNLDFP